MQRKDTYSKQAIQQWLIDLQNLPTEIESNKTLIAKQQEEVATLDININKLSREQLNPTTEKISVVNAQIDIIKLPPLIAACKNNIELETNELAILNPQLQQVLNILAPIDTEINKIETCIKIENLLALVRSKQKQLEEEQLSKSSLQSQLHTKEIEQKNIQTQINSLSIQITPLRQQKETVTKQINHYGTEIDELNEQKQENYRRIHRCEDEMSALRIKNITITTQLTANQTEIATLQLQCNSLAGKITTIQEEISQLKNQKLFHTVTHAHLPPFQHGHPGHHGLPVHHHIPNPDELAQEHRRNEQISRLESKLAQLQAEKTDTDDKLLACISMRSQLEQEGINNDRRISNLDNECSQLMNDITQIERNIPSVEVNLNRVKSNHSQVDSQLLPLQATLNQQNSFYTHANEQVNQLRTNINKHNTTIQQLQSTISDKNTTITQLQYQVGNYVKDITQLEHALEQKQREKRPHADQQTKLNNNIKQHTISRVELLHTLRQLEQDYLQAINVAKNHPENKDVINLTEQLKDLTIQKATIQAEIKRAQSDRDKVRELINLEKQNISKLDTRHQSNLKKDFLFRLTQHPEQLVFELHRRVSEIIQEYEDNHIDDKDKGVRLCLAEYALKIPFLMSFPVTNSLDNWQQRFYELYGLLLNIFGKAIQTKLSVQIYRVLNEYPIDYSDATHEYNHIRQQFLGQLHDMDEYELDQHEHVLYQNAFHSFNQIYSNLPNNAPKDARDLYAKAKSVIDLINEQKITADKKDSGQFDLKFHTTIIKKTTFLMQNPTDNKLRKEYKNFIALNNDGQPSVAKKVIGAIMIFLGAVLLAVSVAAKIVSIGISAPISIAGMAAGGALIVSGIGLFAHGRQKGLAKGYEDFSNATQKASASSWQQQAGYESSWGLMPNPSAPLV